MKVMMMVMIMSVCDDIDGIGNDTEI